MERKKLQYLRDIAFSLHVWLVFSACSDGSSPSGPAGSNTLSVVIAPGSATIGINGAVAFVAVGHEASGKVATLSALEWSSLDASTVSLDSDHVALGLMPGIGRIVARNGPAADTVSVVVENIVDLTGRDALQGIGTDPFGINDAGVIVGQTFPVSAGPSAGRPFAMRPDWHRTPLVLPGGFTNGRADDISDSGVIVGLRGSDFLDARALVWSPSGSGWTVEELPWSGGQASAAHGVSPNGDYVAGQLVVELSPNQYWAYPCLWVRNGANGWTLEQLSVTDGMAGFAEDVNDSGEVVGGLAFGEIGQAVMWRKVGGAWVIEKLGVSGTLASAHGINSSGVVAGQWGGSAVTWVKSGDTWKQRQLISPLDGVERSFASGINDAGEVVGALERGGSQLAFRWKEDQPVHHLRALSARGAARAINSEGKTVGVSFESNGATVLGTFWPRR